MIIDKLNLEPNRDKKGIFKFTILPEKVKDLKLRIKKYPDVHIYIYIYIYIYIIMIGTMIEHIQVKWCTKD